MLDDRGIDLVMQLQDIALDALRYHHIPGMARLYESSADLASALLAGDDDLRAASAEVTAACADLVRSGDRLLLDTIVGESLGGREGAGVDAAAALVGALSDLAQQARTLVGDVAIEPQARPRQPARG